MAKYDELKEKRVSSEEIFDGSIFRVFRDSVKLPDGNLAGREYMRHSGGACVVPLTDEREVVCVRQYRYPTGRVTLEVPAGKLNPGETDAALAAKRELKEETGAECDELIPLGDLFVSPALSDEVIHMFLAPKLGFGEQHLDDDEFLYAEKIPLDTLVDMIMRGEILDAKTQAAVLKTKRLLDSGKIG